MRNIPHVIDIIPGALLFRVADSMSVDTTRKIARFMRILDELDATGIKELIPSYASVCVIYDETVTSKPSVATLLDQMWIRTLQTPDGSASDNVTIDVVYGDEHGEDLTELSAKTGLTPEEVITLHVGNTYTVGAVGFAPGFTYLIGLHPKLANPRRSTPRLKVPAGSVGIGGSQTGVYALPSAGGWNLIGRSPTSLFNAHADPPVRLKLGDTVTFRAIPDAVFADEEEHAPAGGGPIEVLQPGMQATIQDLGRYGTARYGFATDGAADRVSLVEANRLVGNPAEMGALEIAAIGPSLRFHRRLMFALAGADLGARLNGRHIAPGRRFETMPGDELRFDGGEAGAGFRSYLAVRGGFDVPLVMGSVSTNLLAGIGGWQGRALMRGDRLPVGQRAFPATPFTPGLHPGLPRAADQSFRVIPGPQRHRFSDSTWERFLDGPFTISNDANRVALRLLGPPLVPEDGADMLSEGIVTGSIQVTGEGQAILMLPGHATIGGYTKIATVIADDWDRLGQLAPGDEIRFVNNSADSSE